jgi:Uma2 family endonuclease
MPQTATVQDAAARYMSIAEWVQMPEDEPGELLDGRLVEEEVPDLIHETVVSWLIGLLRGWIIARGGFVFGSEGKFVVAPERGRKPDVTVFFPAARMLPRRGAVHVPPDVAVEVVSPTPRDRRRDRIEKPDDYAAFGVRYYWIIDPEERSLEILELGADGRYVRALGAVSGRLDPVPGCDGLVMDLDEMWAEIDRLGPEGAEDESR